MSVTITKIGDESPPPPKPAVPAPTAGKKKSIKTFPRGILKKTAKIHAVRDPAKPSAMKRGMKKHTLRMLTDKGLHKHRKTLKKRIAKLSDTRVKEIVQKAGLVQNAQTPPNIARQILDSAASAGFVSV
jgi:hypothetical protein